jgi:histidinol phosphatase-like enzyme
MSHTTSYCFDLDGTICNTIEKQYSNATPYLEVIRIINKLYDDGCKITIFTARGGTSKIDYNELTVSQLKEWNVKYH